MGSRLFESTNLEDTLKCVRVFLTKPDERGYMSRARVVKLINEFDNNLDKDSLRCKFKIEFQKNTPAGKDTFLDNIMSYNDILHYFERETNNEDDNKSNNNRRSNTCDILMI